MTTSAGARGVSFEKPGGGRECACGEDGFAGGTVDKETVKVSKSWDLFFFIWEGSETYSKPTVLG